MDVVGHTNPLGDAGYNDKLGQQRAACVAQALIRGGAPHDAVCPSSQGERRPLRTDPEGYGLDRRAELSWYQIQTSVEAPSRVRRGWRLKYLLRSTSVSKSASARTGGANAPQES